MRTAIAFLLVAIGSVSSGCSICAPGYLCDYAGVGGKYQRSDPENGRVGSIFSDPNSVVAASASASEVLASDESNYEEVAPSGESILEPTIENLPPSTEDGVIILGDQW